MKKIVVAGPGIEPGSVGYEPTELPLFYPAVSAARLVCRAAVSRNNLIKSLKITPAMLHRAECV